MKLKHIWLIFAKEMLNMLRDRRTLIIIVVVPLVLMPLLVLGPNFLRISQEESRQSETQEVAVVNSADGPELTQQIEDHESLAVVDVVDPQAALDEGEIAAIVVIPEGFEAMIESESPALNIEVRFDQTSTRSQAARDKLMVLLSGYRTAKVQERIAGRGIDPEILVPFQASPINVAPPEQVSGYFLGLLLPLFLTLWAAVGGAQTAIDVTAGEKERQTLESILVLPASRTSFVVGKYLSVFIVTIGATVLSLGGFALSLTFGGEVFPDSPLFEAFKFAVSPQVLALLFATTAVLAAMMSALTFALFLWTRNFKEAQSYTTYLSFAVMIPAFAVSFGDVPTNLTAYFIPIYNVTAVIKEIFLGDFNLTHILITYITSGLIATIALAMSVRMFNNESVLFRQ